MKNATQVAAVVLAFLIGVLVGLEASQARHNREMERLYSEYVGRLHVEIVDF